MNKRVGFLAIAVTAALMLTGCTPTKTEPKVIHYPSYPEQESAEGSRYDITSGADSAPETFSSETVSASEDIDNVIADPAGLPRELVESVVFDIAAPVDGQPFIVKTSYKSESEGYFVGVSQDGSYTEPISYFDEPGTKYAVVGTYPKAETVGIKFFGTGKWDLEISPLSQLPVFDKELEGSGSFAFIVNGDTLKITVESERAGLVIRSYGYDNRIVYRKGGGGTQTDDTALPGNGAVIIVENTGSWTLKEAKEIVVEEDK